MLTVTIKSAKNNILHFRSLQWGGGGDVFFDFLKAKNCLDQKPLCSFGKNKKNICTKIKFSNFLFGYCSLMYKKGFCKKNKKKYYFFKVPVIFGKSKFCRAFANFYKLISRKKIPKKKLLNHSTRTCNAQI